MELLCDRVELVLKENPELGQSGLVAVSGASKSVVNQWLDDKIKSMRLDYALNIEQKLGYNHIWLVLGEGEKRIGKESTYNDGKSVSPDEIAKLITLYGESSATGRRLIIESAESAPKIIAVGRGGAANEPQ
jgi:hypothetical protein